MPKPTRNLKNKKFGYLTAKKHIWRHRVNKYRISYWFCQCKCGKAKEIYAGSLISKKSLSCGCLLKKVLSKRRLNLINRRFGRLIAKKPHPKNSILWFCHCDCGTKRYFRHDLLQSGRTQSCGCFHRELISKIFKKHGMRHTKVYEAWVHMRNRCNNPNDKNFKSYGGRGIRVYSKWNKSFLSFYSCIGDPPTPKHSLERRNNNGNYVPSNIKWATKIEQANNTRRNRIITHKGTRLTLMQWSRKLGKNRRSLAYYLDKYSVERAFILAK